MNTTTTSESPTTTANPRTAKLPLGELPPPSIEGDPNPAMPTTSEKIRNPQSEIRNPKVLDTWDIPFPKSLSELAALDSTREIPYLKALCNRRQIRTPGPNPTPTEIIPIIERILAAHIAKLPRNLTQTCDIYVEWKLIHDDLQEFLTNLRSLDPAWNPVAQVSRPAGSRDFPVARSSSASSANSASSALNKPVPHPQTPSHSNNPTPHTPKTPAIQTNPSPTPKTFGHSNNSPQIISSHPQTHSDSPHPSHPSHHSPDSHHSHSESPGATRKPRRNNPVLASLTDSQKQQLVDLCQTMHYRDAAQYAREKLGIQISAGTLCNLCTTWQIREDEDTRAGIQSTHNTSIESLTEKQLQLRLLELASRPNMDHTELRAICHSFARLQSVKLSERRVQLAEAKEARIAQTDESKHPFNQDEYDEAIDNLFGVGVGAEPGYIPPHLRRKNQNRGSGGDEALNSSAPFFPDHQSPAPNPNR